MPMIVCVVDPTRQRWPWIVALLAIGVGIAVTALAVIALFWAVSVALR